METQGLIAVDGEMFEAVHLSTAAGPNEALRAVEFTPADTEVVVLRVAPRVVCAFRLVRPIDKAGSESPLAGDTMRYVVNGVVVLKDGRRAPRRSRK